MSAVTLHDCSGLDPDALRSLAIAHRNLSTLERVLDWGRGRTPPLEVLDIVTQDEYTHDVIVGLEPGRFLVYDTT